MSNIQQDGGRVEISEITPLMVQLRIFPEQGFLWMEVQEAEGNDEPKRYKIGPYPTPYPKPNNS